MDLTKIPNDIIINHIIPFTYQVQSKKLLKDIQSFYRDYKIVINYYSFDYNDYILCSDLIRFVNINYFLNSYSNNIEKLFERSYFYNNIINKEEFIISIENNIYNNYIVNPNKVSRIIFGLLKPYERTRFLYRFVIPYDIF
uniref:Uncharacterized protein n=1 Tax=viral metagenome TaxID=1070528 RepID=A0A6C0HSG7_9ZZZZ